MIKKLQLFTLLLFVLAEVIAQQKQDINLDHIDNKNIIAWEFMESGVYDSAKYYYQQVINLNEAALGHFSANTADSYMNLGVVLKKLYHLKKALDLLNTAESIYKKVSPNTIYLGYIYNNKANIYYTYSDYDEAEIYYRNSINHFINIDYINNDYINIVYLNLFNLLLAQNRLEEAEQLINSVKNLEVDDEIAYTKYLFLAHGYELLGETQKAYEEYNNARQSLLAENLLDPHNQLELNHQLASLLISENKYNQALNLLMQNLELFPSIKTIDFKKLTDTYLLIGNLYYLKEDYYNCYNWLKESIDNLQQKLAAANLDENSVSSRILSSFFIDIKHLQAKNCIALYNETNNQKYLNESLELYASIIDVLKVFRLHMKNESSKLRNTASRISIVHEAINLAMRLYKLTGDYNYYKEAFNYAENVKSFVLLSEIKSIEAMKFSNLPDDVLERESNLSNEISGYEELLYNERVSDNPDSLVIARFNKKLFELKDNYNTLLDSIELNYPRYFELKYSQKFITPIDAQKKLDVRECLVEYVLADTALFTFVIDKDNINVITQNVNTDFSDKCFQYFTLLQNQDFSNNVHETYRNYVEMGRMFYETLVEPVLELTDSREITFVPDGAIMYLPFESFLTEDVDMEYIDYHDLPYLIYDLSVGYSYSSTLLFSDRMHTKSPSNKVLAFAPEYENVLDKNLFEEWSRQSNRDLLMPLPGAEREVEYIARTVPADIYMDYEATESNFKSHASDYSVLHLAMHTIMDDENPMYSKLAFARNFNDSTEDHDLFTFEIYNLKLNAEMVVLSSCSSGFGKIQKGEGMMSMARGFIYAGCPSIVMTLWQVSDLSSAELMSGFYKHLKKGKSKKNALRDAKIDYIQSSDKLKSNPYFWSAFMMVGDNTPLYRNSPVIYLVIIVFVFTLLALFLSYKRRIIRYLKK